MIPNYYEDVKAARAKYPDAWKHAHVEGDPRRLDWIQLLAKDLHMNKDSKVGANGKRGNPIDLSADAINILCDKADSHGRTPEGLPCVVVDVIGSAGARPPYTPQNREPYPVWNVYDTFVEGSGAHVDPSAIPAPVPAPIPAPVQPPGREEALAELRWLHGYYMAQEGLQRPRGLWRDDTTPPGPDFEGIAAWYLDGYQRERMAGKSPAGARAAYVAQIMASDEFRRKHP